VTSMGPAAAARPGSLRRSVNLFRAFRVEQTDPERFYTELADDTVRQISRWLPLGGMTLLDVGGGPGFFREAFEGAGARYLALDADAGELGGQARADGATVLGSGLALPLGDACVDVAFSSNVLEHVPAPETMADEMVRVTRPGGHVVLSYTLWWSPWGGHETAPWHYLGGERAALRYVRRHGHEPKNRYGRSLFPLTAARMLRWSRDREAAGVVEVLARQPRYHPDWARWVVRVPGLREVAGWNLLLVLRRH
jgi:SAM-dependent methyltransferase